MEPDVDAKIARLRDVGLMDPEGEVPEEYRTVVDSFSPDELEMLISVRKRLVEASRVSAVQAGDVFFAP